MTKRPQGTKNVSKDITGLIHSVQRTSEILMCHLRQTFPAVTVTMGGDIHSQSVLCVVSKTVNGQTFIHPFSETWLL